MSEMHIWKTETKTSGISLLEYFAARETLSDFDHPRSDISMSIAVELAGPKPTFCSAKETFEWEAKWRSAIRIIRAKAMIEALEKEQSNE